MKICKKCGAVYDDGYKYCKKCGSILVEKEKNILNEPEKKGKKKKSGKAKVVLVVVIIIVFVAALFAGGFCVFKLIEEKNEKIQVIEEDDIDEDESEESMEEESPEEIKETVKETEKTTEELAREEEARKESIEQEELLKAYEEQERADAEAEAKTQMHQVLKDDEVEAEILRIRAVFTECVENSNAGIYQSKTLDGVYNAWFDENGQLRMIDTTVESTTSEYERIFIYENEKLIFAYLKTDGNESRLYYKDDNIFRWSYPKTTDIQDNNFDNPEFVQNGIEGRNLGYELYNLAVE